MFECAICYDEYELCEKVSCDKCSVNSCKKCAKSHIMNLKGEEKCFNPSCGNDWDLLFCIKNLSREFVDNEMRQKKEKMLLEAEKAKTVLILDRIAEYKNIKTLKNKQNSLVMERDDLLRKIRLLSEKEKAQENDETKEVEETNEDKELKRLKKTIIEVTHELIKSQKAYSEKYGVNGDKINNMKKIGDIVIRNCPNEYCGGYLNVEKDNHLSCTLCGMNVCEKCMEEKKEGHVCLKENIKTVQFIKNTTKPCPECGVPIHKISGCDQMWCVKCKIPYSWKTGQVVSGDIHNPHYYEWQRREWENMQNGQKVDEAFERDLERQRNNNGICSILSLWDTFKVLRNLDGNDRNFVQYTEQLCQNVHRLILHVGDVIIRPLRNNNIDNGGKIDICLDLAAKEIEEEKGVDLLYERYIDSKINDILIKMYQESIDEIKQNLNNLVKYFTLEQVFYYMNKIEIIRNKHNANIKEFEQYFSNEVHTYNEAWKCKLNEKKMDNNSSEGKAPALRNFNDLYKSWRDGVIDVDLNNWKLVDKKTFMKEMIGMSALSRRIYNKRMGK